MKKNNSKIFSGKMRSSSIFDLPSLYCNNRCRHSSICLFRYANELYCAVLYAFGLFSANASGQVQNFVLELTVTAINSEQCPPMPSFVGKREKPLSELCKRKRSARLTVKKKSGLIDVKKKITITTKKKKT